MKNSNQDENIENLDQNISFIPHRKRSRTKPRKNLRIIPKNIVLNF